MKSPIPLKMGSQKGGGMQFGENVRYGVARPLQSKLKPIFFLTIGSQKSGALM